MLSVLSKYWSDNCCITFYFELEDNNNNDNNNNMAEVLDGIVCFLVSLCLFAFDSPLITYE